MRKRHFNSESGMALLLSMAFIATGLVVLSFLTVRMINQRRSVDIYKTIEDAFRGCQNAYAMSIVELEDYQDGTVGAEGWSVPAGATVIPAPQFGDTGVTPLTSEHLPDIEFFSYAVDWLHDGIDNNGDGTVDGIDEDRHFTLFCVARNVNTNATRTVEAVLKGEDVNAWNNAVFAGAGQAGGLINGNVSLHGSVHLLGDHVIEGAEVLAAIALSGTSLIHNNYEGLDPALRVRVPALPLVSYAGEQVESINASLRVRHGLVGMDGTSEIGEPQVAGNAYKETMDGCYVTDGWTGNSVTGDGLKGDPQQCYSDNGWDEDYNLGDKVPLPIFEDDWRDPVTGERVWDSSRNEWYTHGNYFNEVLLAAADNPGDGVFTGDLILNARGNKTIYWNATTGEYLEDALPATPPAPDDDFFFFDPPNDRLYVNGQITIDGTLSFVGQGGDTTINYSGRGAILTTGDIEVDANLLACNDLDPANTANAFPANNIIGLMSATNMTVGTSAQLNIMGAFYAQGSIICAKQTTVLGTFVANYFDMGTNVPDIYQVPELAANLPLGMVGNFPILAFSSVSWREL